MQLIVGERNKVKRGKKSSDVRIAFLQTCDKSDERNFMDYQIEQFTYGWLNTSSSSLRKKLICTLPSVWSDKGRINRLATYLMSALLLAIKKERNDTSCDKK